MAGIIYDPLYLRAAPSRCAARLPGWKTNTALQTPLRVAAPVPAEETEPA